MPRQLNLELKQKIRGTRRRLKDILALPKLVEDFFPEYYGRPYHDFKLPIHRGLVEGPHSSVRIQRLCIRSLLETCTILQHNKPSHCLSTRVVAIIDLPAMFGSRVTIFYDEDYFSSFFDRDAPWQRWTLLPPTRSLLREWEFSAEFDLPERGYAEEINDEDMNYTGEIWFYGDIDF